MDLKELLSEPITSDDLEFEKRERDWWADRKMKNLASKLKNDEVKFSESDLQKACVSWFKTKHPNVYTISSYLQGNINGFAASQEANMMGYQSGCPDLFIVYPSKGYHGLFIEFKSAKGRLSNLQKCWRDEVIRLGYQWELINNYQDFINLINGYILNNDGTL
jgi:hypothetical protein